MQMKGKCKGCLSAKFNKNNAATSNSALKIKDNLDEANDKANFFILFLGVRFQQPLDI